MMSSRAAIVFSCVAVAALFAQEPVTNPPPGALSPEQRFRLRSARSAPGLPVPPAGTHWLTTHPIVIDCFHTQTIALVTVTTVTSNEAMRTVFHKGGVWRTQDWHFGDPMVLLTITNTYTITNAPTVDQHTTNQLSMPDLGQRWP